MQKKDFEPKNMQDDDLLLYDYEILKDKEEFEIIQCFSSELRWNIYEFLFDRKIASLAKISENVLGSQNLIWYHVLGTSPQSLYLSRIVDKIEESPKFFRIFLLKEVKFVVGTGSGETPMKKKEGVSLCQCLAKSIRYQIFNELRTRKEITFKELKDRLKQKIDYIKKNMFGYLIKNGFWAVEKSPHRIVLKKDFSIKTLRIRHDIIFHP